jgi:hypothetical protein
VEAVTSASTPTSKVATNDTEARSPFARKNMPGKDVDSPSAGLEYSTSTRMGLELKD